MSRPTKKQYGFGMVEVLISAAILAIGLIGLASLQSKTIQAVQDGDNLVTAAVIAQEMGKRMLSNPYITAKGRAGYLATDLNNDVANAGGVVAWAAGVQSANPNIARCYPALGSSTAVSCYNNGATIGNSAAHQTALNNAQLMDQVEMRLLAWDSLPNGQIMICFDSTTAFTSFSCDNVATRVSARNENVFTVKVQWTNLLSNTTQMYTAQFTAQCTVADASHCL